MFNMNSWLKARLCVLESTTALLTSDNLFTIIEYPELNIFYIRNKFAGSSYFLKHIIIFVLCSIFFVVTLLTQYQCIGQTQNQAEYSFHGTGQNKRSAIELSTPSSVLKLSGGKILGLAAAHKHHLIVVGIGKNVIIADASSNKIILTIPCNKPITCLTISSNESWLAVGEYDGAIRLVSTATWQSFQAVSATGDIPWSLAFSPDDKTLIITYDQSDIKVCNVASRHIVHSLRLDKTGKSAALSSAFSPDGKYLAIGSGNKTVFVIDTLTWHVQRQLSGLPDWIMSIAFSPDGKILATGTSKRNPHLLFWNTATWTQTQVLNGFQNDVKVIFAPDGAQFTTTDWAGNVKIWNTSNRRLVATLLPKGATIACYSDGNTLITGSEDSIVRIWDIKKIPK